MMVVAVHWNGILFHPISFIKKRPRSSVASLYLSAEARWLLRGMSKAKSLSMGRTKL